jgi:hypothetical protein
LYASRRDCWQAGGSVQKVSKNQEFLSFCKNNQQFCLQFNIFFVSLPAKMTGLSVEIEKIGYESTDKTHRL